MGMCLYHHECSSNIDYIAGKKPCIMEIHITQDEREELLKSLQEKKEMKKRLASELSQFKDCDPATITTWVVSVCPLLSLYKSGAEVYIFFSHVSSSTGEQTRVAVDAIYYITDGQVSLSFILLPWLMSLPATVCILALIRKGVWEKASNFLTDNVFAVKSGAKHVWT